MGDDDDDDAVANASSTTIVHVGVLAGGEGGAVGVLN